MCGRNRRELEDDDNDVEEHHRTRIDKDLDRSNE
jgi:hypothetical protein